MTDSRTAPGRTPPSWAASVAGLVGAGVALGVGELLSGFTSSVPSLVVAIGEVVVDKTPGDLTEAGIQAAGTNDKPALLAGIVLASLIIGALLGRLAVRYPRGAAVGFLGFGAVGGWAAARNPFASTFWSWFAALVAAVCGVFTMRVLLALAALPPSATRHRVEPAGTFPTRRAFLTLSGGAAVAALASSGIGRALRRARSVESLREQITLPAAGAVVDGAAGATTPSGALDTTVKGISPYLTPNDDFYRIDTALTVPQVDPKKWKLKIGGLVENPYTLTYDEILAMDLVDETVTLACVSNEVGDKLVGNATWRGVRLADLLGRAKVKPDGTQLVGISVDDFDAGFPTELALDGRTALLAVGMNGQPLPVDHGFPARLVIAGIYGYVSAVKWIEEIRLTTNDYDGYWVPRGWAKLGPMKTQSRIDVPRNRSRVVAGRSAIAGVAWAPTKGIAKVEIKVDTGEWRTCTLGGSTSDETWVQWYTEWDATRGDHVIEVRATDKTGYTQSPIPVDVRPDGAEGHHTIRVSVS